MTTIAREILVKAKQILVERGWCKFALTRSDGSCCMLGAINAAVSGDPIDFDVSNRERFDAGFALRSACGCDPADYNDFKATKKSEVLAKFDEAIELASTAEAA